MAEAIAELYRRVIAAPDDHDARRVLADALLEAGDPRGELIQAELALDGPLAIRIREELAQRHIELKAQHWQTWFPEKVGTLRTRGGFAHSVKATLHQLRGAASLFAREPIVELEVTELDEVDELLAMPWLPRIEHVIVRGKIGDAGHAAIWASPATQQLRALNVSAVGLGRTPLADLADKLPRLTTLVLSRNRLHDGWLAPLHRWRGIANLSTLYLADTTITSAVPELLAGPWPALRKLVLSGNRLPDDAAQLIALAADRFPALRHLELHKVAISVAGIGALVAAFPALTKLDLRGTGFRVADRTTVRQLAPYVLL